MIKSVDTRKDLSHTMTNKRVHGTEQQHSDMEHRPYIVEIKRDNKERRKNPLFKKEEEIQLQKEDETLLEKERGQLLHKVI
ncbi:MAG: hypothetical protein SVW57_14350 [Thermodesulfobacteriota bacterium]|nr:hypothetical protein [Thermodesulfobacteriota bacterium]